MYYARVHLILLPLCHTAKHENWQSLHEEHSYEELESVSLADKGIHTEKILRNPNVPLLYELGMYLSLFVFFSSYLHNHNKGLKYEKGTAIVSSGALCCRSGARTGRSPKDKRIFLSFSLCFLLLLLIFLFLLFYFVVVFVCL